jgi:integrase/recombinase XerC
VSRVFRIHRVAWCLLQDGRRTYRTSDGRRVTRNTSGAVREDLGPSECYYGKCPGPDGRPRRVKLCTDKGASKQMLAKLLTDARLRAVGLADPFEESHKRPLAEHVEDYRRHLLAKGDTEKHAKQTARYVEAVLTGCKFVFIPDLSASAVAEFLHGLRLDPARPDLPPGQEAFTKREVLAILGCHPNGFGLLLRRAGLHGTATGNGKRRRYPRGTVEALLDRLCRGRGAATSNAYLTAVKGFTRWLAKDRRTGSDPLTVLSRVNARADVRRQRRALPEPELRALLNAAAESATVFRGLTGWDRRMVYAVAMATGFRAGELASLEPGSFALDSEPPTATVRAAYSKNRRESVQPLPPDVAAALRAYLAGRPVGEPVWPGSWADDGADMLRIDLEAAGIPFADTEGRVCDFHALRHSYITLLQRSGVHPKVAQELARHSDIRLTMNVYTHAHLHDLAGAVEGLPSLLPSGPTTQGALKATGTAGTGVGGAPDPRLTQTAAISGDRVRGNESSEGVITEGADCGKPLPEKGVASESDPVRLEESSAPRRTRTYNPLIKSQLLCQLS